jgi:hypothetical protein
MDQQTYLLALSTLPGEILRGAVRPINEALNYFFAQLPPYPTQEHAFIWDSPQQRAEYWKLVREGLLDNPYQRSGFLTASFRQQVNVSDEAVNGRQWSPYPEHALVIGDHDEQLRIHQDRWWSYDEEIDKNTPEAMKLMDEQIGVVIDRVWSSKSG